MMIENIEINKPYSVELSNEVAELTVENLHKFTENYEENHQQLQINRSLNAIDISSLNSINNKDKDMQKINENNSTISYTKKRWFGQNGVTQFNQTNKKLKLDRSFVNNKSLSATNNFLYVNENSNPSFKYDNVNINANAIQDIDNNFIQESSEIYCDTNKNLSNRSKTIFNLDNEKNESKLIKEYGTNVEHFGEDNLLKYEISACSTQLDYQKQIGNKTQDDSNDDDYISIYSNTSLILDEILMSCYKNIETNKCEKNKIAPNTSDTSKQHNNLECVKALDTIAKSDIPLNNKLTNLQNTSKYKETQKNNTSSIKTISTHTNKSTISNNNRKSNLRNNNNKNSLPNGNCNVYSTNTFSDNKNIIEVPTKVQLWSYDMHREYCLQIMKDSFCRNNINKKCLLKHEIFCKEINCGEYYVSEIIKHAVRIGANDEIIDVLVDIAIYILMKLVINEIWILAYKLLNTLEICFVNCDATFLLLSAEIYLANNQVNKAFMLLKESNIISSNHQDWNVLSKPEDCYLRTKIIQILLDALCKESSENAFFMFQFLAKDQNNNYEPIGKKINTKDKLIYNITNVYFCMFQICHNMLTN
ncbi:PREDICTED: putative uncharacterized protein DDB_G0282499 [Polistes canadensis]|uniref:putative uncharacterized protein DDB_G0282499 n=1 Tax=Polistes canadensis TaxID=91411 RepID=UPI000718F65B|nr:PREDICTED: putative uncharacterized protein DDB_G0282499 [Polistes canadensis]